MSIWLILTILVGVVYAAVVYSLLRTKRAAEISLKGGGGITNVLVKEATEQRNRSTAQT